jgi:polyisoprenoid-binding protein YceI
MRLMQLSLLAFLVLCLPAHAATYVIDPHHTYPQFEIRHLSFSTLHGQFNHTEGRIVMDREKKLGSVEATIDVNSLDTGFAKRDDDLLAASFFDAQRFPTITYKSTRVTFHGKDKATVEGDFTLRGVTRPLTLHVTRISCGLSPANKKQVCGFDAWGKIRRSDYGMKAYLPFIPDEVKLIINSDAIEQTPAN